MMGYGRTEWYLEKKNYDCRPAVSKFSWSLFIGDSSSCAVLPQPALAYSWLCGTHLDVLFGVLLLSGVIGTVAICESPTQAPQNRSLIVDW
jgi:hypothetical protein